MNKDASFFETRDENKGCVSHTLQVISDEDVGQRAGLVSMHSSDDSDDERRTTAVAAKNSVKYFAFETTRAKAA
jgi:hypothetical protein